MPSGVGAHRDAPLPEAKTRTRQAPVGSSRGVCTVDSGCDRFLVCSSTLVYSPFDSPHCPDYDPFAAGFCQEKLMEWHHIATARRIRESESGAILRDWGGRIPVVLAYPNTYAVGMSSLAIHGLYRWFNVLPGVVCERAFASLGRRVQPTGPIVTLESQRPLRDAALVAFSVPFEMDYVNVISMLRRASIPVRAEERADGDPLIILGGPAVSANPEPLAVVADAIVIGEAETLLAPLVDCIANSWQQKRDHTLEDLASLPGIYVPLVHQGKRINRQWLEELDDYPTSSSIVAPLAEFGDMHLIEVSRGCGRGCRFCLAGHWYRPPRERSLGTILEQAREGLKQQDKIGLVASAVSDYSHIDELVTELRGMGAAISVSSLRVAPLSPILVRALREGGARTITLAPEAGSEGLRRAINKGVTHDDIMAATALVASERFEALKLYFMFGLPGESDGDIEDLLRVVAEIKGVFTRRVIVSLTPFVPKAHTPFQRAAMVPKAVLEERLSRIGEGLRQLHVEMRAESIDAARIQCVLARGDRRVGEALLAVPTLASSAWERALALLDLDMEEYLRERSPQESLPWHFVDSRVAAPSPPEDSDRIGASAIEARTSEDCILCHARAGEDRR